MVNLRKKDVTNGDWKTQRPKKVWIEKGSRVVNPTLFGSVMVAPKPSTATKGNVATLGCTSPNKFSALETEVTDENDVATKDDVEMVEDCLIVEEKDGKHVENVNVVVKGNLDSDPSLLSTV